MPAPTNNSQYRLLVEGSDDMWSIISLLERHGYDWNDSSVQRPYVRAQGGIKPLIGALSATIKTVKRLGIVVDANGSIEDRWASIRDGLYGLDFAIPTDPDPAGLVVDRGSDRKRIGIWLMPDNQRVGALEDFLATLVPVGDACWEHAGRVTTHARALGAPLAEKDQLKGAIHTWLSWRADPGHPFGLAIKSHSLMHDSPEAIRFVDWFNRVFT